MIDPTKDSPGEIKRGPLARLLSNIKTLVDPELPITDRRAVGRLVCELATTYLTETGDSGEATVLDVSRRGFRIRTASPVRKGMTVALKPPEGVDGEFAPLMAKTIWNRREADGGFTSGLLLPPGSEDEETWLEAFLIDQGFSVGEPQRRRYVRADADLMAVLMLDAQAPLTVRVVNLGLGGALLRSDLSMEKQSSFRLRIGPHADLPELELSGTVLRQNRAESGEGFDHSTRFGPLEQRRHALLKEYIVSLLNEKSP